MTEPIHEGEALQAHIKEKGYNARKICRDLDKSTSWLQAIYKKKLLGRYEVALLNDLLDENILQEIGVKPKSELSETSPNNPYNVVIQNTRIIIDFENGKLKNVFTQPKGVPTEQEQEMQHLKSELLEVKGLLKDLLTVSKN